MRADEVHNLRWFFRQPRRLYINLHTLSIVAASKDNVWRPCVKAFMNVSPELGGSTAANDLLYTTSDLLQYIHCTSYMHILPCTNRPVMHMDTQFRTRFSAKQGHTSRVPKHKFERPYHSTPEFPPLTKPTGRIHSTTLNTDLARIHQLQRPSLQPPQLVLLF